jgi:hypothetical protein
MMKIRTVLLVATVLAASNANAEPFWGNALHLCCTGWF